MPPDYAELLPAKLGFLRPKLFEAFEFSTRGLDNDTKH